MHILPRDVPRVEAEKKEEAAPVSRRVEVTVERETVTLLIRGQPEPVQKIEGESAGRSDALESRPPELPPALLRENEIALVRHDGDKQKQSARNR